MDDTEDKGYARLNILLPEDTVTKLDELQTRAGFRSRGRTVQDIVDTIISVVGDIKDAEKFTESCFLRAIQSDHIPELSMIGVVLINITKRLNRYQLHEPTDKKIEQGNIEEWYKKEQDSLIKAELPIGAKDYIQGVLIRAIATHRGMEAELPTDAKDYIRGVNKQSP